MFAVRKQASAVILTCLIIAGCSKEPSVHQEVLTPPAPAPQAAAPAAQAPAAGAANQAAQKELVAPAGLSPLDGFTVTTADAKGTGNQIQFQMPQGWTGSVPNSMFRIYQAAIPKAEGDNDNGDIAFFAPIGGSIDDNVNRWLGQFQQPDGSESKTKAVIEDLQGDHYKVKMVSLTGSMLATAMMGAPASPERAGWMMLGSIIETPAGVWYIKATGPEKTLTQAKEKFFTLCKSVLVVGGK